jgi:hypothetical protein
MKLHIDTHPWFCKASVFVDDLDISVLCRGVDLEARTLYLHRRGKWGYRWEKPLHDLHRIVDSNWPDLEVTLGVTVRLRLMLDGHEIMAQGLDLPAAMAQIRQAWADAHGDIGKAPSSEVLGYLLASIEDALAPEEEPGRSPDRCLHPVRDRIGGRCPDCGDCTHLIVQADVCQACAKVLL